MKPCNCDGRLHSQEGGWHIRLAQRLVLRQSKGANKSFFQVLTSLPIYDPGLVTGEGTDGDKLLPKGDF